MPISSGVLWMVYADTAFLRKLECHNLCPLATIPRHRCGQRVYNCGQKPPVAPSRSPKPLSGRRSLQPRTSENSLTTHFALCTVPVRGSGRSPDPSSSGIIRKLGGVGSERDLGGWDGAGG